MAGPPRRTSCLLAESPGFTELGAPSFPGVPVSPLPGQCINSQPWLRALTHCVAPLMRGRPGRRRRQARATGLSPVGPPWAGAEAAWPRGWGVALCTTTALAGAVSRLCVRGARGRFGGGSVRCLVLCLPFFPKQELHRPRLGNGHIDLHANILLAERVPDPDLPPLIYNMHTHLQHVRPIPNAGEPPALLLEGVVYNSMGQAYHYRHPLSTMAYIGGTHADTALMNRLQHELAIALYFSALESALLPVHLQTQGA